MRIVVAGVPRGLHDPADDGRWLTGDQISKIQRAAPDAEVIHTSRWELERGEIPDPGPSILLIEVGADPWYEAEIPEEQFARLVTPNLQWIQ
ncbi:MAG: hypothetical protein ACOC9Y_06460, partial [Chloroflexota bacterium]